VPGRIGETPRMASRTASCSGPRVRSMMPQRGRPSTRSPMMLR
jgi:hypothetical protein